MKEFQTTYNELRRIMVYYKNMDYDIAGIGIPMDDGMIYRLLFVYDYQKPWDYWGRFPLSEHIGTGFNFLDKKKN